MKQPFTLLFLLAFGIVINGQSSITAKLVDEADQPVMFANAVLYKLSDNSLVKVETSDTEGKVSFANVPQDIYTLKVTYVGYDDLVINDINTTTKTSVDLGSQSMAVSSVQLEAAVVTAQRSMVEVKPDRTVFNVQGTVNSAGDNGLGLLRKAPGVLVDNNNNVSVLSRSGVLFYIDGKRLPLAGDDLTNYLENIPAEQIDRIDIITNPGAKYEAEGNAGIINIKFRRDKNLGTSGNANISTAELFIIVFLLFFFSRFSDVV